MRIVLLGGLLAAIAVFAGMLAACAFISGSPKGIDLEERVQVDGAQLYLMVRGDQAGASVLLWLHGGPGGAERPLFRMYNSALEHRFVVAYLDQRGTGRSFDSNADPRRLTIAQHLADLDIVVDLLRREHHQEKIILLGHSWGTALGLLYTQAHPEKVAAFIGAGQVTSELARQRSQYEFVEQEATQRHDKDVLTRLAAIGPPPFSAKREIATQRLVENYGGYYRKQPSFTLLAVRLVLSGYVTPWEIGRLLKGNWVSLEAMNDEILQINLPKTVPTVRVPVAFFLGRYDRQVDSQLAADYFEHLSAPAKRLVWFESSAHNMPFEEPDKFNAAVPEVLQDLGVLSPVGPR
jgi:proline iminopeptidase